MIWVSGGGSGLTGVADPKVARKGGGQPGSRRGPYDRRGQVIQAVSQGEERAGVPLLPALRQDLSRRHSGPCLRTGARQPGGTGRRWAEILGNRVTGFGGVVDRHPTGVAQPDVPTTAGAAGDDPEARRRRAAARDSDGGFIMHLRQSRLGVLCHSGFCLSCAPSLGVSDRLMR